MITKSEDYRHLIIDYLNNIHHSEDEASIARIAARARSYTLMDAFCTKRGSPAVTQMHNPEQWQRAPPRNPFRDVWLSH